MQKIIKNSFLILSILTLINCQKEKATNVEENSAITIDTTSIVSEEPTATTVEQTLKNRNDEILKSLKAKNYAQFSEFIHPEKGIYFSMYPYFDDKNGKYFSKTDFDKYAPTNIKFTWGEQDGTGDPLVLPIRKYLEEWAYSDNFLKSNYYQDEFKGSGNSINNIQKKFPNLHFTENYVPGTEEYGGMNWGSLIFVFEELNGTYYLVAFVNNSWTI